MKILLRKKWFRRLCQTLLALCSLLVLAYVSINWWGARMKRDVIAQMRAEGRPTSLAEMLEPLPRDEDNFAMIPALAKARVEWWNDRTAGSIQPDGTRATLAALGAPDLKGDRTFGGNGAPDLSRWKEKLQLRGNDVECLATYDRDHAEVLGQLRAGLIRQYTVSPMFQRRATEPKFYVYPWGCRMCLEPLAEGFAFRAELALAANRPDVVQESLLVMIRLAEMIRGELIEMGPQYQTVLLVRLRPTLARALESGQLDKSQIASIKSQLAVIDPMRLTLRGTDLGNFDAFALFDAAKEFGGSFIHPMQRLQKFAMPAWANQLLSTVDKWLKKAEPGGLYDANAALGVRTRLALRKDLGKDSNLRSWLQACERADARAKDSSNWDRWLYHMGYFFSETGDVKAACRLQTFFQQALLACDLETYRLDHGRYPERLQELNSPAIIDSITSEPYRYRTTDSGYLLYSVGADAKDDGGKRASDRSYGNNPDWIW